MYQQLQMWLILISHATTYSTNYVPICINMNCANVIPLSEKYNSDYVYPHSSVGLILLQ